MKKNTFNWDDWYAAISDMRKQQADVVPAGWVTCEQFASESGKGESHARKLMSDLFRSGKAERKKFNVVSGDTGVRGIYHYKLLPK